ncbi:helix-turn-helix domain-containing protein [Nitrospirillum amazonense]|uniref:helix-turn-helix domain-containing protein n=1 Tax=Nitrospirillum amazonense TaxID=28077 RepID=UPI002412ACF8|nr:helix-turn-helix domain-containing protein [Nitrospirillum amazonense]MDG3444569.1 helix-turn-helix domain-containing protein [Nitrospirillum amazonense]
MELAYEMKIEQHLAGRIRLRRGLLGLSQVQVADALGLTFQQVQKYESGANRVSIARLVRLADVLNVPITFFFDGMDGDITSREPLTPPAPDITDLKLTRRDLDLLRAWRSAPANVADCITTLLRVISQQDESCVVAFLPKPAEETQPAPARRTYRRRAAI